MTAGRRLSRSRSGRSHPKSLWSSGAVVTPTRLPLEQSAYRVRYLAIGMGEARAADPRLDGQPQLDRYLLQF